MAQSSQREHGASDIRRFGASSTGLLFFVVFVVSLILSPQVHAQQCTAVDTCATASCNGGSGACVMTTENRLACIVRTCVAPCTTTADCPPTTVCFTLGCCGPATFCVPLIAYASPIEAPIPIPATDLSGLGILLAVLMLAMMVTIRRSRRIEASRRE